MTAIPDDPVFDIPDIDMTRRDDNGRVIVVVPRSRATRVVYLGMRAALGSDRLPGVITGFDSDGRNDPTLWITMGARDDDGS